MNLWVAVIVVELLFSKAVQHDITVFFTEQSCLKTMQTVKAKEEGMNNRVILAVCEQHEILG